MKTSALSRVGFVAALFCSASLATAEPPAYDVHEWGTFTSLQTLSGECLNWAGVPTLDLPAFVWSMTHPGKFRPLRVASKSAIAETQRMETPVLYFYPDRRMKVTARVDFPQGTITEWFPQATSLGPTLGQGAGLRGSASYIEWRDVELLAAPSTPDPALLPAEKGRNHYYAARNTNSSLLVLANDDAAKPEHEKFLFYRGLGGFDTPLVVRATGQGNLTLENRLDLPLVHIVALEVDGEMASFTHADQLLPGQELVLNPSNGSPKKPIAETIATLRPLLVSGLTAQGLYPAEAAAMVETWEDTWFTDQGTRVLYILPREWTDATLPLHLDPAPRSLTRVMVGRVDSITPEKEREVREGLLANKAKDREHVRRLMGRFAIPMSYHALRDQTAPARELAIGRLLQPETDYPADPPH